MNSICDMLGIKYPIFQGAMAWVSNHAIAAAVSKAGGLGIIAAGNAPADWLREEIRACKKVTDKPFGVNVMLLSPHADEVAKVVAEEGVKVVTTGAGNPGKYMELWKSKGIKVIPVVPSVAIAKRMEKEGADAIVAEGCESGGHIGELTTMALIPQVVDAVSIPVIAAGGIADGRGFAAAMMLGAQAVQIGTRFLVAEECTVHEAYKEKVLKATDIDTVVTGRSTGHPVRVFKNQMTRTFMKLEKEGTDLNKLEELGAGGLYRAVIEGDVMNGSVMAGQIAGLVKKRQPAEEIIEELMKELKEITLQRTHYINENM
ncbi:enoyl-[acyl-carrier-protein] reductase FabK [Cellulosilyticum sp. I15G10I2]|uniref:enoyl-[acyl-carrier-protein] reductase FabK n=1 Tax=Cellulosilyticum sp. I15G10I2 TaxID=1892843 RepID=UPI00085C81E8|nr:enoyl-[acyl-carrier-protein] reductase FabK [Cellulosilyticum sp. I15G10I2]